MMNLNPWRILLNCGLLLACWLGGQTLHAQTNVSRPVILDQPSTRLVPVGGSLTLSCQATGSLTLHYQWSLNGTPLPLGTSSAYSLTNAQAADAGIYTVTVTNTAGSATATNTILSVVANGPCAPVVDGLAAWWRAEGDGKNTVGDSELALKGGATYAPGWVGQGFSFNGSSACAEAPAGDLASLAAGDFSVEFWVNFRTINTASSHDLPGAIFIGSDEGGGNVNKWLFTWGGGDLMLGLNSPATGSRSVAVTRFTPQLNQWYHLALVRRGSIYEIYRDGLPRGSETNTVAFPQVNAPLVLGQAEGIGYLNGIMDEVSIFRRALAPSEVRNIYEAGREGKCGPPLPPRITDEPFTQYVSPGAGITLTCQATGSLPLTYQWSLQGKPLPGRTSASLTITNAQLGDAGAYAVAVTNAAGWAVATNATLIMVSRPCQTTPGGMEAWWRAEADGQDAIGHRTLALKDGATFAAGQVGLAFSFNGINAYAEAPASDDWALSDEEASFEFWVNFRGVTQTASMDQLGTILLGCDEGPGLVNKWIFGLGGGRLVLSTASPAAGAQTAVSAPFSPQPGRWYHLALVQAGTGLTIYQDGQAIGSQTLAGPLPRPGATLTLGQAEGIGFLSGLLDEVTFYRRALTAGEIQAISDAGPMGKCGPADPPRIWTFPADRTVAAGGYVAFEAAVAGSGPMTYQWRLNGTNLPGQNTATLTLTNAQAGDAGNYSLRATNPDGEAVSANARLSVVPAGTCVRPSPGLVAWWRAEGNSDDSVGSIQGALLNGARYDEGKAGRGFGFDGSSAYVEVPDNALWAFGARDFSFEFWVYFHSLDPASTLGRPAAVFLSQDAGGGDLKKWLFGLGGGNLFFGLNQPGWGGRNVALTPFTPESGRWYHLALTRAGEVFTVYIDGTAAGGESSALNVPAPGAPLTFGQAEGLGFLDGGMDEVSIYNQALSAAEVRTLNQAGSGGKCLPPWAPTFLSQPQSQAVVEGSTTVFAVAVAGTEPLAYQWLRNGTNLPGATMPSLTLLETAGADAGAYAVVVSNLAGHVTSAPARLTVVAPGECAPAPEGLVAWWRAEGNTRDSAGTNEARLIGGAVYDVGQSGAAFSFNGTSAYVEAPASDAWVLDTGDFSVELWVNFRELRANSSFDHPAAVLLGSDEGGGNVNKWYFVLGGGSLALGLNSPLNGSQYVAKAPFAPEMNRWYHLALVRAGNQFSIYQDGQVISSEIQSLRIPHANATLTLGQVENLGFFDGLLDEVALYHRALGSAEVQTIYQAGPRGKCGPALPPVILTQPRNVTTTAGGYVTLKAVAGGTEPLHYQWRLQGVNLPGQTSPNLTLINVQTADAGNYSLEVANAVGSILSGNALLTVNPATACSPAPDGMLAWWRGEGTGEDSAGSHPLVLTNLTLIDSGLAGGAFSFDGIAAYAVAPYTNLWVYGTNDFSWEFWVNFRSLAEGASEAKPAAIFLASDAQPAQTNFWRFFLGNNKLLFTVKSPELGPVTVVQAPFSPVVQVWYHLALIRQGNVFRIQRNAEVIGTATNGLALPRVNAPLYVGQAAGLGYFDGMMDEVTLYGRGLSAAEVGAIYLAGNGGKCQAPIKPHIFTQPQSLTVQRGGTAVLSVLAGGSPPLEYQWSLNDQPVAGATNAWLVIEQAQSGNAGTYRVAISNSAGGLVSDPAVLQLVYPSAIVSTITTNVTGGGMVEVPIFLTANGNENSLSFSLGFNAARLSLDRLTWGEAEAEANVIVNTNQLGAGWLGMAVALPGDLAFTPGETTLATVRFRSALVTGSDSVRTDLTFADTPMARQLADAQGQALPVIFGAGSVVLDPTLLEGDVTPRPNGDGVVAIADWTQAGRFAARLDAPAAGREFQRADCAPRASGGDGVIKVTDWVQTGRYAAGLDPLDFVSGPTETQPSPQDGSSGDAGTNRAVRLTNASFGENTQTVVTAYCVAHGDENAFGFSVSFDPALVRLGSIKLAGELRNATLFANTNDAASGMAGVILGLAPGTTFAPGSNALVNLTLSRMGTGATASTIAFGDRPLPRCVSDALAVELAASYSGATINPTPAPALQFARAGTSLRLSWTVSASAFELQTAAGGALLTGPWTNVAADRQTNAAEIIVTLPLENKTQFYRLRGP